MSLYIDLRVGPTHVDRYRVSRISNTDTANLDPDTVSTYQIDRAPTGDATPIATVEHRYGDGATELARLTLNVLAEQGECELVETTAYTDRARTFECTVCAAVRTVPRA